MKKIIIDACTYSNFARTDTFWIMEKLLENKINMTYLVLQEIREGFRNYPKLKDVNNHIKKGLITVISELSEKELGLMASLPDNLSNADKSCLAASYEKDAIIVSDDARLISEADNHHIHNMGTLKIISLAIKNELITCEKANEILETMKKEAGFLTDKHF